MAPARNLTLSFLLLATGPLTWLACGGGKPPETPADESASSGDDGGASAPASSAAADMPATSDSSSATDTSAAPAASSAAPAAPPPAPAFGDSDCGKCVDKACAKPAGACGKNTDCQSMIDGVHSCSGTGGTCVGGANLPSAKKPKALGTAWQKCANKALTSKACKASCQ
jgi:hypothetical protein